MNINIYLILFSQNTIFNTTMVPFIEMSSEMTGLENNTNTSYANESLSSTAPYDAEYSGNISQQVSNNSETINLNDTTQTTTGGPFSIAQTSQTQLPPESTPPQSSAKRIFSKAAVSDINNNLVEVTLSLNESEAFDPTTGFYLFSRQIFIGEITKRIMDHCSNVLYCIPSSWNISDGYYLYFRPISICSAVFRCSDISQIISIFYITLID